MQINWFFILLLAAVGIVFLVVVLSRIFKVKPHCPYCDSTDIVETSRQTMATRTIEIMGSGTPAGGNFRVQFDLKISYHCHNCGQRFSRTVRETH